MSRCRFIAAEKGNHPVARLCRVVRESKSGFYTSRVRPPAARAVADASLPATVRAVYPTLVKSLRSIQMRSRRVSAVLPLRNDSPDVIRRLKEAIPIGISPTCVTPHQPISTDPRSYGHP